MTESKRSIRKDLGPSYVLQAISASPPLTVGCLAIILTGITLAATAMLLWQVRNRILLGTNDFLQFYAGARLAGSADLYDPVRIREVQVQSTGVTGELLRFVRLPYYAGLLWPLGKLPYLVAYYVWQFLALAALAMFVLLWHGITRHAALLFSSCSFPVYWSFANGQDLMFLLVWFALSVRLHRRGHWFWSGFVLSLCAAKYHLFLLVPLVLWQFRNRRPGYGFLVGSAVLLTASFVLSGPTWPSTYWDTVVRGRIHPGMSRAPNLYGLADVLQVGEFGQWAIFLSVVAAVWLSAQRGFEPALACAVAASIFVAPHVFIQDAVLLLPAALVVLATPSNRITHGLALFLLMPVHYLLQVALPFPWKMLFALNVLGLVYSIAWDSLRTNVIFSTDRS